MTKDRKRLGTHLEELPVKLADGELLERAKRVGDVHQELQHHIAEADGVKRNLKHKEAELTSVVDGLLEVLRTGHEPREVKVEAWADYKRERFQEIRTDTGAIINERALRPEERQGEFDLEAWGAELHQRALAQAREDVARRRAGDVDREEEP